VGSSPTAPTDKVPAKHKNMREARRPGHYGAGLPYTNYYTNALSQRLFHRLGGLISHVGEFVRVGVQGYGYTGVT
jgi:hypothetical protein